MNEVSKGVKKRHLKIKKCQEVCGEQAGSHPWRGEQTQTQWGRGGAAGAIQTHRMTGCLYTLFCFRRARKYIHHQKNYKVLGTSHFPHCWEQPLHTLRQHSAFLCLWQVTTTELGVRLSQNACSSQPSAVTAHTGHWTLPLAHRPVFCQDTQQNLFSLNSPPYCSTHNKKQSPSNCCKIKISRPGTSLREMGETQPPQSRAYSLF